MQAPPKFSSFRAKPAPPKQPEPPVTSTERETSKHDKKIHHTRHHRDSSRDRHRHRTSRRDRSRSPYDGPRSSHGKQPPSKEAAFEQEEDIWDDGRDDLYVIDRRGDVDNVRYGYNNKYKVPEYRQPSLRKLLGNDGLYEDGRAQRASLLSALKQEDKQRLRAEPQYVRSVHDKLDAELDHDFLVFNHGKKRKRKLPSEGRLLSGTSRPFAIEDIGKNEGNSSSSEETTESSQGEEEQKADENADLKAEKIRLTRLVKDEPTSVAAWLEYITFQASWIQQGHEDGEFTLRREDKMSLAEVKLSIYKKALASVSKGDPQRETLLIGMMEECETVLEATRLAAKWRQVVADNPNCIRLGMKYVNYLQSNLVQFDYGNIVEAYMIYIGRLQQATPEASCDYLYAILRLTTFMSEAAYHERAVAIWQALLELTCFTNAADTQPQTKWSSTLSQFEEFWEDERPRIGEMGASGWRNPDILTNSPFVYAAESVNDVPREAGLDSWIRNESERSRVCQMPGRLVDEGDEGDDYHVVLFTDIQSFLPQKKLECSVEELLDYFLCFIGLPPVPGGNKQNIWLDQYLGNDADRSHAHSDSSTYQCRMPCYRPTLQTVFDTSGDFQRNLAQLALRPAALAFVGNTLDLLVAKLANRTELAEYYLALALHTLPVTSARKTAKSLIKLAPSNLRLYNAYAIMEMRLGNPDIAAHAIRTALGMSSALDVAALLDQVYLWYTYSSEAVLTSDLDQAIGRFQSIAQDGSLLKQPAGELVHAERYLNAGRQRACDDGQFTLAAKYCSLLSMLYYTTSSGNLSIAIEAFSTQCSILASYGIDTAVAIEVLHQDRAELIETHITHTRPYKPAEVRLALQDSISTFPSNTIFLALYAQTEARFRMDDRVRQLAKHILGGPTASPSADQASSLVVNIFAIENEIRRSLNASAGSTKHAVRAAFERAVADKQSCHCANVWFMFLDYELSLVRAGDMSRLKGVGARKVKDVFYRGLRCLPWHKMWYMKGVEVMIELGQQEEAREVVKMMEDKGLRMLTNSN